MIIAMFDLNIRKKSPFAEMRCIYFEEKRTDFYYRYRSFCRSTLGWDVSCPAWSLRYDPNHSKRRRIRHIFPCKGPGDQDQRYQRMRNKEWRSQNDGG